MTTIITRGSVSAQALGYAARATAANYIEDVFSTYLYTGNGSTQTITNGIDLSTKGGMVWLKSRSAATNNFLFDTSRGVLNELNSNTTDAQASLAASLTAFNATGFSLGAAAGINVNAATYASWTFRKQAKFFDVVTYTGNGVSGRTISHNLGSAPGCLIVKCTSNADNWYTKHRSLAANDVILLDSTAAAYSDTNTFGTGFTFNATNFQVGNLGANESGRTYVAYLFAHDAGGFGSDGLQNVISCGSYTGTGASVTVNLGYEPQWILVKKATGSAAGAGWRMYDNMRGMPVGGNDALLSANLTNAEISSINDIEPSSTGFIANSNISLSPETYIYIAIRRGPMRTPMSGTSVFSPNAVTISGITTVTTGFPVDMSLTAARTVSSDRYITDRLRGITLTVGTWLLTNSTSVEAAQSVGQNYALMTGIEDYIWNGFVGITGSVVFWNFRRAPGFFDVVCYTGTGANTTQTHNLGVVPELILVKRRSTTAAAWAVYSSGIANTEYLTLNTTAAKTTGGDRWNSTTPTSSVFSIGTNTTVNASAATYVAYLFATVAGVSKVGTYTGNGSSQTVNCGFTAGSRFVMIKRTDSTGNWVIFDSARGIVAGNDPALYANANTAEVTTIDAVDTDNSGFIVNQDATLNLNVNAATYTFLAIA